MKILNKNRVFSLFIFLIFLNPNDSYGVARYPFVSSVLGKVQLFDKKGFSTRLSKGKIFQKYALIVTDEKSQIKIEIDRETTMLLGENSQVEFPAIVYEDGEVSDIILLSGLMRVQSRGDSQRFYSTPLTHQSVSNADFVLDFNRTEMKTRVYVISGSLDFRGIEAEEVAKVQAHEKSIFSGVIEDGKPSFDILLGGKKVAKGKLGIVEPIAGQELASFEKKMSLQEIKVIKKKVMIKREKDQICEKPFGRLNECSWACDKWDKKKKSCAQYCIRRRCDANGKWTDDFIDKVHLSKCTKRPLVETCDY